MNKIPQPEEPTPTLQTTDLSDPHENIPTATASAQECNENIPTATAFARDLRERKYEVIRGLWVRFSDDAEISLESGYLSVRADSASLGENSIWTAKGFSLKAKIAGAEVQNLVVSLEELEADPLLTRAQVVDFLNRFGLPKDDNSNARAHDRSQRMSKEQWEQFLMNVKTDTREQTADATLIKLDGIETADHDGTFKKLDLKLPRAQVKAARCQVRSHNTTLNFPDCQGSEGATLRTLLEYYTRSLLNEIDLRSGDKADVSMKAVASDVASVKASMLGASVGAVLLGPAGFVAGSYFGDKWMRRSCNSVQGAAAGAALFGPVGLAVGAVAGDQNAEPSAVPHSNRTTTIDEAGVGQRSAVQAATDQAATSKYEYAGSAGVMAGAAVGTVLLGPIGLVAGSVAGSVSSRKLVEKATTARNDNIKEEGGGYRFGDFTRGIVARGKQARSADAKDGYRFGDFTRGLWS